jgi:hypothetical protein
MKKNKKRKIPAKMLDEQELKQKWVEEILPKINYSETFEHKVFGLPKKYEELSQMISQDAFVAGQEKMIKELKRRITKK